MPRLQRLTLGCYLAIVGCFLFTFGTVSCEGLGDLRSLSGVQLVTGTEIKAPSLMGEESQTHRIPGNPLARIALLAALAGAAAAALRARPTVQLIPGVVAGFSLLLMRSAIQADVANRGIGLAFEVRFRGAYWLAVTLGGLAAAAALLQQPSAAGAVHRRVPQLRQLLEGEPALASEGVAVGHAPPPPPMTDLALRAWRQLTTRFSRALLALRLRVLAPVAAWAVGRPRTAGLAAGLAALLLVGYVGFLRPTPERLATAAASAFQRCDQQYTSTLRPVEEAFLGRIRRAEFRSRGEALRYWNQAIAAPQQLHGSCRDEATQQHLSAANRFSTDPERATAYYELFARTGGPSVIEGSAGDVPSERLTRALAGIHAPAPDGARVARDLLGSTVEGWRFADSAEVRHVSASVLARTENTLMLAANLRLTDYVTQEPYVARLVVSYAEDDQGEWVLQNTRPVLVAKEASNYLRNNEIFLVGRWRWQSNSVVYAPDGTWRGRWDDGSEFSGTWRIVHDRLIATREGRDWWQGAIAAHDDSRLIAGNSQAVRWEQGAATPPSLDSGVRRAVIDDPDGYTNVRAGASATSPLVATIREGEEFTVMSSDGDWWTVRNGAGQQGFVHRSRVRMLP